MSNDNQSDRPLSDKELEKIAGGRPSTSSSSSSHANSSSSSSYSASSSSSR